MVVFVCLLVLNKSPFIAKSLFVDITSDTEIKINVWRIHDPDNEIDL